MTYTIKAARFNAPDNTVAVLETEEAGFVLISQQDSPDLWAAMLAWGEPEAYVAPITQQRIEWGNLIRALTPEEAEAFDARVQAAPARFRWLVQKTGYISTDDPDYPTLKAAFDDAYGKERSGELLPPAAAL